MSSKNSETTILGCLNKYSSLLFPIKTEYKSFKFFFVVHIFLRKRERIFFTFFVPPRLEILATRLILTIFELGISVENAFVLNYAFIERLVLFLS